MVEMWYTPKIVKYSRGYTYLYIANTCATIHLSICAFYRSLCESIFGLSGEEGCQMEEQREKKYSCCSLQ